MAKNRARYNLAVQKGTEFNEGKQWKEAVGAFRVALSEFKTEPEAYAGLGKACSGLKQYPRALDCYKLAARYSRGDAKYMTRVADMQERLGKLSDAGRSYMAAGEYYLRQKDIDSAISNWERAVRLESNLLGAHQRLAMAFQRQGNSRGAVREYLAIARILDMQGDSKKALQMCRAAMRLDPDNPDIITAVKLIQHGVAAYPDPDPEAEAAQAQADEPEEEEDSIFTAVRQMASVLESEKESWGLQDQNRSGDPVQAAKTMAQEQLAEELFRDEDEDEDSGGGMIKLERDALIGQGIDFESRGEIERAIQSYEKAIAGGLSLSAAYFTVGMLHMENGDAEAAAGMFEKAIEDERYVAAIKAVFAD